MKQHSPPGIYAHLISFFIAELEQGFVPWHKPWTNNGMPMNLLSLTPYSGINTLYLASLGYSENFFLTLKEIKSLNATVKDNVKGHPVILGEYKIESGNCNPGIMINQTIVFNIAQCDGIPRELVPEIEVASNPVGMCQELLKNMPNKPVICHQGVESKYRADMDLIYMPLMLFFEGNMQKYYADLFKEIIHATGHEKRLNRIEVMQNSNKDLKELTAEIGLWHLISWNGIKVPHHSSKAYRKRWIAKLQENHRLLLEACLQAQYAAGYMLNVDTDMELAKHDQSDSFNSTL